MTELPTETFAGSREDAERHLAALGHPSLPWRQIDALPADAAALFAAGGTTDTVGVTTRCKHTRVECADGSTGIMTVCWTTHEDYIEEWSNCTCDN